MNDLRILIARLGWPTPFSRWWTIQELAARLGDPDLCIETESVLLQFLRSRKLEAEVIEVLCIFWMAVQEHSYSATPQIAESISKPSLLSDLLIENIGLSVHACSQLNLKEAPSEFRIPDDFNGMQGVNYPRVFITSLKNLEKASKFPFVRQMAFEWTENLAIYPDAPTQGNLSHFTSLLRNDSFGTIFARAALRYFSAYLRTLSVAKRFWNMPPAVADQKSLLGLPVHPSLAFLRPQRPDWFPQSTDFDGTSKEIGEALRAMLGRLEAMRPGDELIAFNSPVIISMERCVEVSVVRWSQATGSAVGDADLAHHLDGFWDYDQVLCTEAPSPFSTTTIALPPTLKQLMDDICKAWPLARTLDFKRIGYLQYGLYPSRLFFPTLPSLDRMEITPRDGKLEAKVQGQVIADLSYWNAGWGPTRPSKLEGNCGTALISRSTEYRKDVSCKQGPLRMFYLWQVRTLFRSDSFNEFRETRTTGTLFI